MASDETPGSKPLINTAAPASFYVPLTWPPPGTALSTKDWPKNEHIAKLFTSIKLREVTFNNRAWVSPMCQYSCESGTGKHSLYHTVHLGRFALGGAGLIMVEASAVTPYGMISPEDSGIWSDEHIQCFKRTVEFVHSQGGKIGIQIAHAGRKASTYAPWLKDILVRPSEAGSVPKSAIAGEDAHGWPTKVVAPSKIPFDENHAEPVALDEAGIQEIVKAFEAAAIRAEKAGFDVIEIHGAHGYLIHSFMSPISNQRTDKYGGSLENRMRLPLEITKVVRAVWPASKPLFYRISTTDWHPEGERNKHGEWISWGVEQSIELVKRLQNEGVDLVDASSGGNDSRQKIPVGPSYQVPNAAKIKQAVPSMPIGAVGLLTTGKQIEEHLQKGEADAAFLAREWLRDPNFALTAARDLGAVVNVPVQEQRAFTRLFKS